MIEVVIDNKQLSSTSSEDFVGSITRINASNLVYVDGGAQGIVYKWKQYAIKMHSDDGALVRLLDIRKRVIHFLRRSHDSFIPPSIAHRTLPIGFGPVDFEDLKILGLDDMNSMHAIVFRWISGETLNHRKERPFGTRIQMSNSIIDALLFLEKLGVVHADLAPKNFIIDKRDIPHMIDIVGSGLIDKRTKAWIHKPTVAGTKLAGFISPPEVRLSSLEIDQYTDRWYGLEIVASIIGRCFPFFFLCKADLSSLRLLRDLVLESIGDGREPMWPPQGAENHPSLQEPLRNPKLLDYYRGYWDDVDRGDHLIQLMYRTFIHGFEDKKKRASFLRVKRMIGL